MPSGDAVDFKYYQYTDDSGGTWSVKVDKTWGDNVDADFAAHSTGDVVMPRSSRFRPRTIVLQDLTSGRKTTRVVGSLTADAWTDNPYTTTGKFRGLAGAVTLTKIDQRGEHLPRSRTINSMPEPSTA